MPFGRQRFFKADSNCGRSEREHTIFLYAEAHFRQYLAGRQLFAITDCSVLTWLFPSRDVSPKNHRWVLKFLEDDILLQWKRGTHHSMPDGLSRLPRTDTPQVN